MASTFTNIGLEDQATGENSGTWGDKADANFIALDMAIAGVKVINFASDANKTITVPDGSADDSRAMALLVTGTQTARTLTIAPNDMEKVYIINNGTSGELIVSQGSGASVTIQKDHRVWVYCDGGGAGAIIYNAYDTAEMVRPLFNSYSERRNAIGATSSATCDMSAYSVFTLTVSAALTINFTNAPVSGLTGSATVVVTNHASSPISSIIWQYGGSATPIVSAGGVLPAPTATNDAVDVFTAFTEDAGTTFYIAEGILDVS